MKALIALVLLFASSNSTASLVGCETTIGINLNQMIEAYGDTEELFVNAVKQNSFSGVDVYLAYSATPEGSTKVAKTTWVVLTRKGPMNTCEIEQVLTDVHVE